MAFFLGIIYAIGASISWGVNSHILKAGAQNEHPYVAMVYRAVISLPILVIITAVLYDLRSLAVYFQTENLLLVILLVLSIIVGDSFFIHSMKKYEVSIILPIAASYPLLTSTILIVAGIEFLTPLTIIGTLIVVIGIFIVTRYRIDDVTKQSGISIEPIILGLGVALGWGSSVIFARLLLDKSGTESFGLMTIRTMLIGILAFIFYFQSSKNRIEFREKNWKAKVSSLKIFGISGIFGWVFGASLLFLALENTKAGIATPISASNPVIAVIIGHKSGIDKINYRQFIGILLTITGVILIVI